MHHVIVCKIIRFFLESNCIIHLSSGRTALFDLRLSAPYNIHGFFTCYEQYNRVLMSILSLAWLCTVLLCLKEVLNLGIVHVVLH